LFQDFPQYITFPGVFWFPRLSRAVATMKYDVLNRYLLILSKSFVTIFEINDTHFEWALTALDERLFLF